MPLPLNSLPTAPDARIMLNQTKMSITKLQKCKKFQEIHPVKNTSRRVNSLDNF